MRMIICERVAAAAAPAVIANEPPKYAYVVWIRSETYAGHALYAQ